MKKIWAPLLAVALNLPGQGAPAKAWMVLSGTGPLPARLDSGQFFAAHEIVQVPAGCTVTVLLLGQGKRLRLCGPCTVTMNGSQMVGPRSQLKEMPGKPYRLNLSGENHRQVAGGVVREAAKEGQLRDGGWKIALTPFPRARLLLSEPASAGPPPTLQCEFFEKYADPKLSADLSGLARGPLGASLDSSDLATDLPGRLEAGRWHYALDLPKRWAGRRLALRLSDDRGELLCTPLYGWSRAEAGKLQQLKVEVHASKAAEPWVVYAVAAEELGQLREALRAVQQAISLKHPNPGLRRMAARLQVDVGELAAASESLTQALKDQSEVENPR
ncbi:hypothetical protein IV102_29250 [bacterium]|nr:hypothetical protein [bacterium]